MDPMCAAAMVGDRLLRGTQPVRFTLVHPP